MLAIGGVKEKILAAKQRGLQHVIFPKQNQKELDSLTKLYEGLEVVFVDNVNEVLTRVLLPLV